MKKCAHAVKQVCLQSVTTNCVEILKHKIEASKDSRMFSVFNMFLFLVFSCYLNYVICFIFHSNLHISSNLKKLSITKFKMVKDNDISSKISNKDYVGAYRILKGNPMAKIDFNDGCTLLSNLDLIVSNTGNVEKDTQESMESCTYIYRRMERQGNLKGFNCVEGEYPEKSSEISPVKLEEITGLNVESFTPKQRTTYWRLAGIGLCGIQLLLGNEIGIDPLTTTIPLTLGLLITDQIVLKGAIFETIYQTLFPEYKDKILYHEAGHFLLSYLLGVPVRGCVTSAWDARKYKDIQGQAGTIFFDSRLAEEISRGKVTRSSLDRMSVVVMAGIAAEALKFGRAEGGAADERTLIGFLSSVQPPWNMLRVQGQARWGVTQAILLIKEHQESYDALVEALREKKPVGDCVKAIEENLPQLLPAQTRKDEREDTRRRRDTDMLMRYVQKMTYMVGGINKVMEYEDANNSNNNVNINNDNDDSNTDNNDNNTRKESLSSAESSLDTFTKQIRMMEIAVQTGKLPVDEESPRGGGVWLNGLSSRNGGKLQPLIPVDSSSSSSSISENLDKEKIDKEMDDMMEVDLRSSIPKLIEGYEERIAELDKKDVSVCASSSSTRISSSSSDEENVNSFVHSDFDVKNNNNNVNVGSSSSSSSSSVMNNVDMFNDLNKKVEEHLSETDASIENGDVEVEVASSSRLLASNRGYMMKKIELEEQMRKRNIIDMNQRLQDLQNEINKRSKKS